jgi:predicted nicotinamide N-methyase
MSFAAGINNITCTRKSALIIPIKPPDGQPKVCDNACKLLPFSPVHSTLSKDREAFHFVRPTNPDDVLDSMTEEQYEKDKFLPYWAQQWPACLPLFNYISLHATSVFSASGIICEIGSGLGIVSSLLSLKKMHIVATDISPDACRYSAYNMRQYSSCARVICSDWRASPFTIKFDTIIASDILYEQRWISPVLAFLSASLKNGGAALIADPCRQWWLEFQGTATTRGFTLSKVWQEVVNEGKTTVEILRLTLLD